MPVLSISGPGEHVHAFGFATPQSNPQNAKWVIRTVKPVSRIRTFLAPYLMECKKYREQRKEMREDSIRHNRNRRDSQQAVA